MKRLFLTVLVFLCFITSVFSIWTWKQEGNEFLLISPTGDVELGFKVKRAFMPIEFNWNNSSYLYFIDANNYLRAYKLRQSGSAILNSLISIELDKEWGHFVRINQKNVKAENEIGLRFADEKTRIFLINPETNQFEIIRESYY